jgi:hypothetical protein
VSKRKAARLPERGDLVEVVWLDITENPVGDPDEAAMSRRVSYGLLWDQRKEGKLEVLVTTTTRDAFGSHQSGWCIYPMGCIESVKILKRARKAKAA